MNYIIREAGVDDVEGIAKVHVDSWKSTYKGIVPEEYLNTLTYNSRKRIWDKAIPNGGVYVAINEKGEIVGFSSGGIERSGDYPTYQGEIYAIYLLKQYQGKGLGKRLVEPIKEGLINQGIFTMLVLVLCENDARFFYESLGAREVDQIEVTIGGEQLKESVYVWDDVRVF